MDIISYAKAKKAEELAKTNEEKLEGVSTGQTSHNLDTKERFTLTLEVKDGKPRLKMEGI